MSRVIVLRWLELSAASGGVWALWCRMQARAAEGRRERREQKELRAYAGLEVRLLAGEEPLGLAMRVSRVMAEKSVFRRAAMLVRDAGGGLSVAASAGMEESTVELLNGWAAEVVERERRGGIGARRGEDGQDDLGRRVSGSAFAVVFDGGRARLGAEARGAIVIPLRTVSGRMLGVLAVGADGLLSVRQSELEEALGPLEALALKVARSMENAVLAERLMRAERLANLGMLAGGMAHALSNPLTTVLGYAELIAGSTSEARVKTDAEIVVQEAMRMKQTVEALLDLSTPVVQSDEAVDVMAMVRELAAEWGKKVESRGVRLVVQADGGVHAVWGNRQRLRQLVEYLLNNAAQALAGVRVMTTYEEKMIRISLTTSATASRSVSGGGVESRVHLVVSDTGPGFREPGRVFDPFCAMQEGSDGMGMRLSLCYSIVQEHRGEIHAFNLHPHGAAVAVELPGMVRKEKNGGVVERAVMA